jgi:hypothetical protein
MTPSRIFADSSSEPRPARTSSSPATEAGRASCPSLRSSIAAVHGARDAGTRRCRALLGVGPTACPPGAALADIAGVLPPGRAAASRPSAPGGHAAARPVSVDGERRVFTSGGCGRVAQQRPCRERASEWRRDRSPVPAGVPLATAKRGRFRDLAQRSLRFALLRLINGPPVPLLRRPGVPKCRGAVLLPHAKGAVCRPRDRRAPTRESATRTTPHVRAWCCGALPPRPTPAAERAVSGGVPFDPGTPRFARDAVQRTSV